MKQDKPTHTRDAVPPPADARGTSPEVEGVAMEAIQQLALQVDIDDALHAMEGPPASVCPACDYQNPDENRFCAMCGATLPEPRRGPAEPIQDVAPVVEPESLAVHPEEKPAPLPPGPHYYHHHYHHHNFSYGESSAPALSVHAGAPPAGASSGEAVRTRSSPGAPLSRAETAVRKIAQDWALACNNKQLDDLVSLYTSDAILLRPNVPAIRGTAAIREFFFSVLDAGLGEVEMDPIRTEALGDFAYQAGRCQMLVPVSVSQRREERGKYLMTLARQSGEWKIMADCWASDLGLGVAAEPVAAKASSQAPQPASASRAPRKSA
jgi:ketosteroid isomerase-like protein